METKLKAVRTGNKAAVMKLLTEFEELKERSETEQIAIREFKLIHSAIIKKRDILNDLNEKLIEVLKDENIADEIEETDEYMFGIDAIISELETYMQPTSSDPSHDNPGNPKLNVHAVNFTPRILPVNVNASAQNHEEYEHSNGETSNQSRKFPLYDNSAQGARTCNKDESVPHTNMNHHRLPKLDLPQFDGDVLQWNTFWDSYESTIHYNSTLTPIQKFSYLKAQLVGTAAQTVAGFALTNANYDTAVGLLRERFGQPQKTINAHMKALMDLPSPRNELISLRNYGGYLETFLRGLECLGQTQDMYGALLVPIIISKLPIEIRKNIAREYDCDNINLKTLRAAIAKEVRVLETGHFTGSTELQTTTATFLTGTRNTGKSQHTMPSQRNNDRRERKKLESRPCIYCNEIHFPAECKKVVDANSRINVLKQQKCMLQLSG